MHPKANFWTWSYGVNYIWVNQFCCFAVHLYTLFKNFTVKLILGLWRRRFLFLLPFWPGYFWPPPDVSNALKSGTIFTNLSFNTNLRNWRQNFGRIEGDKEFCWQDCQLTSFVNFIVMLIRNQRSLKKFECFVNIVATKGS